MRASDHTRLCPCSAQAAWGRSSARGSRGGIEPPEHSCRPRHRNQSRCTVHRVGAARRRDPSRTAPDRTGRRAQGGRVCASDRAWPSSRARQRHHPPRSETRERLRHQRSAPQDPRLRAGEGDARSAVGRGRKRAPDVAFADRTRRRARHGRIHGARAGAGPARRSPRGPVCLWRDPLRAALGPARVWSRHGARKHGRHPQRGSGGSQCERCARPPGASEDRRSLPGETRVGPVSDGQRSGICAREFDGRVGHVSGSARHRTASTERVAWLGGRRGAHGDAGPSCLPALERAAGDAQPDSFSDSADGRARRTGKLRAVS